ncbi:MAG TPA: response regulator transcription factor [Anaerolineae bacterium]|nr:response regulator transcription factor [Anaerolineae bacterium]
MTTIGILIIEDDQEINHLIARYLQKEGYVTHSAYDGEDALSWLAEQSFQLVILDLMIPRIEGYEVLRRIREKDNIPVLILSAKSEEIDKMLGLDLGADDYITKPFSMGELIARVRAQLRRYLILNNASIDTLQILKYKDLELDLGTCEVRIGGKVKPLTAKEFELLKLFMSSPTRVFTKSHIFKAVWKDDFISDENTIMVHIRRLRTKIEEDPSNPQYIQTVWGIGYKLGDGQR